MAWTRLLASVLSATLILTAPGIDVYRAAAAPRLRTKGSFSSDLQMGRIAPGLLDNRSLGLGVEPMSGLDETNEGLLSNDPFRATLEQGPSYIKGEEGRETIIQFGEDHALSNEL